MSNIAATKFTAATIAMGIAATFLAAGNVSSPVTTRVSGNPAAPGSNLYTSTRRGLKDWAWFIEKIISEAGVRTHVVESADDTLVVADVSGTFNGTYKRVIKSDGTFLNGTMDGSNVFTAGATHSVWAKQSASGTWQVVMYDTGSADWQAFSTSTNPASITSATGATGAVTLVAAAANDDESETREGIFAPASTDANVSYDAGWKRELHVYSQAASPANTELMTRAGTLLLRQVNLS